MTKSNDAGAQQLLQTLLSGDRAALHQLLGSMLPGGNAPSVVAALGGNLLRMAQQPPVLVLATPGYERMAQGIVDAGNGFFELGNIERKNHQDGTPWQRIHTPVQGREVVVVGGWLTADELMQTYTTAYNAVHWHAKKLTIVIAYHGAARQERAQVDGESVDALFTSHMFTSIPPASGRQNEVILVDIHADAVIGMFQGAGMSCTNVAALSTLMDRIVEHEFDGKCALASPDAGRAKIVQKKADALGLNAAIANKVRNGANTRTYGLLGNVRNKNILLSDDLAVSFGSSVGAAQIMKKRKAKRQILACTHLIAPINPKHGKSYVKDVYESGMFEKVYVTDSVGARAYELAAEYPDFLIVEPLAPILVPFLLG